MTLHKKIFYWFISLVVLVGLVYIGGILFIRNYKPATKVAQQQGLTTPTGMVRDTSGTIPSAFPKELIDINDVKVIQESYSYRTDKSPLRQYTLKYVSDKPLATIEKDTMIFLSAGVQKPTKVQVGEHITSIHGLTKDSRTVDVLIDNTDPLNVIVEVTVFK
jgi:hypothetical protein